MDRTPQPDLNMLDRDALLALACAQQEQLASLIADREEQVRRLEAELDSHRQTLSQQADELSSRSERIEHMKLTIEKLRHMIFGSKSEKIVLRLEQLEFELEEQETAQAEAEAAIERVSPARESKARSGRKPLPEHLAREVVTHVAPGDCCPDCGTQLRQFGEDVSEQLEYIPDSFKVIRHVRPKFSCSCCDCVVEAPASSRPIERGLAGPGLLAHVIVSKYSDHLPLYRQSEIYSRQGVEIAIYAGRLGGRGERSAQPVGGCDSEACACRPQVACRRHAHSRAAPGNGKTKTGRLWTYVRDDRPGGEETPPAVWFAYSEDRKGEHPRQHLENFQGALQADAYAGFHHLYGDDIYEAACWAHARRKFHEIHVVHASPTTTEALARIGALYAIEDEIRGKPVDLRLSVRQSRARPLLDELRAWMDKAVIACRPRARQPRPSGTRSHDGGLSHVIPRMVCSRSTTVPPSGRYEPLP